MGKHTAKNDTDRTADPRTFHYRGRHNEPARVTTDQDGFRIGDPDRARRGVGNEQTGGRDD